VTEAIEGQEIKKVRIPWPGPRPYDEHEWREYFGRGKEITDLVERVRGERLTVLLGGSGSGKTSLIRAGVVANIRNERYLGGDRSFWPVLLLRRWGSRRDSSLELNLFRQVEKAIEPIEKWVARRGKKQADEDATLLRSVVAEGFPDSKAKRGLVQLMEALTRSQAGNSEHAGVILVFDQFEELLRSSERARVEILRIIGDLFESKAPIRILLSMRQEYRQSLRELEVLIGGLRDRSVHLEELDVPSIREVIGGVSGGGDFLITTEVVDSIVEWLGVQKQGSPREGAKSKEAARPDLLRLQSVLVDLCRFAAGRSVSRIDALALDQFVAKRISESISYSELVVGAGKGKRVAINKAIRGARICYVFDSALERWIESAIANDEDEASKSSPYLKSSMLELGDLELQVRRIAVRLAPLLSSADYKVAQEENALLRQALGEDISKLLVENPARMSQLTIIEGDDLQEPRFDWEAIGGVEEVPEKRRPFVLSGKALVNGWTLKETGDRILLCFKETLARLVKGNILQRTTLGDQEEKVYWELVHDQLGPHFTRWAVEQKGAWEDCVSSLVVCRGIQPIALRRDLIAPTADEGGGRELQRISWQGCGVASVLKKRVVFRNVRFEGCFLLGTIFEGIDFAGCEFDNCELKGVLFTRCNFGPDELGKPTVFKKCHSNVAIVGGSIEKLEFRDCQLNQPALKDLVLRGSVIYCDGSKVVQGLFEEIRVGKGRDAFILVKSDSQAAFCFADKKSLRRLKVERENPDVPNRLLPEEFRTRR
jgi:hypothetical protein